MGEMRKAATFLSGNLKRSELERPGLWSEDKLKWILKKKKKVCELHLMSPWIPYKMDTFIRTCVNVGYWRTLFHGICYMVQQLKQSEYSPKIKQGIFHFQCHVSEYRQTPIQHHCFFNEVCGNKSKYCMSVMEFLLTDFCVFRTGVWLHFWLFHWSCELPNI